MINNPAMDLLVYQIDGDSPGFYYFDRTEWLPMVPPTTSKGSAIISFASGSTLELHVIFNDPLLLGAASVNYGNSHPILLSPGQPIDITTFVNSKCIFIVQERN